MIPVIGFKEIELLYTKNPSFFICILLNYKKKIKKKEDNIVVHFVAIHRSLFLNVSGRWWLLVIIENLFKIIKKKNSRNNTN